MANYPKELAQDAAYQSHTGHLTGLWFLLKLALWLNTDYYYYIHITLCTETKEKPQRTFIRITVLQAEM